MCFLSQCYFFKCLASFEEEVENQKRDKKEKGTQTCCNRRVEALIMSQVMLPLKNKRGEPKLYIFNLFWNTGITTEIILEEGKSGYSDSCFVYKH